MGLYQSSASSGKAVAHDIFAAGVEHADVAVGTVAEVEQRLVLRIDHPIVPHTVRVQRAV